MGLGPYKLPRPSRLGKLIRSWLAGAKNQQIQVKKTEEGLNTPICLKSLQFGAFSIHILTKHPFITV